MDADESALDLTDAEHFVLSRVDREQGSWRDDLVQGHPHWIGNPWALIDQLVSRGLLTVDLAQFWPWVRLTDSGREAARRRWLSTYTPLRDGKHARDLDVALYAAVVCNDVEMATWLLDAGANPNGTYPGARTPLETAALRGKTAVARLLVERGAAVNLRWDQGWGPVMQAAWYGRNEIIQLILSAHPDLTLLEAAAVGDLETVRRFLQSGTSPDDLGGSSHSGWTPLDMALRGGHTEVVGLLLDAGATTLHLTPPLREAAEAGHAETVAYLLDRYPDSRAAIPYALVEAAGKGRLEVVRLLLDRGADPNALNGRALTWAAEDPATVRELLERGAVPTPAVVEGVIEYFDRIVEVPEVMALLLEFGADPHAALKSALAHDLGEETIELLRKAVSQS